MVQQLFILLLSFVFFPPSDYKILNRVKGIPREQTELIHYDFLLKFYIHKSTENNIANFHVPRFSLIEKENIMENVDPIFFFILVLFTITMMHLSSYPIVLQNLLHIKNTILHPIKIQFSMLLYNCHTIHIILQFFHNLFTAIHV